MYLHFLNPTSYALRKKSYLCLPYFFLMLFYENMHDRVVGRV